MKSIYMSSDRLNRISQLILENLELLSITQSTEYDIIISSKGIGWKMHHDNKDYLVEKYSTLIREILPHNDEPFKEALYQGIKNESQLGDNYGPHLLYPFKGRMIPDTASMLLNILAFDIYNRIGEMKPLTVLDPFCGSGTLLVEAMLKGIEMFDTIMGNELIPFYAEIAKQKTNLVYNGYDFDNDALIELHEPDWSNPMPTDIIYAYFKGLYDKGKRKDYETSTRNRMILLRNWMSKLMDSMLKYHIVPGEVNINIGSATELNIPDNSIDMIVTSPPYSLALNYQNENPIPDSYPYTWDSNYQVDSKGLNEYRTLMTKAYYEMSRVLKMNRYIAIIIGNQNIRGKTIDNISWTKQILLYAGFKDIKEVINHVIFARYIKEDAIIIARKVDNPDMDKYNSILDYMGG